MNKTLELRAQNAAMDAIPMVGEPEAYRQRIADFVAGFAAAYEDVRVEAVVEKSWQQFRQTVKGL